MTDTRPKKIATHRVMAVASGWIATHPDVVCTLTAAGIARKLKEEEGIEILEKKVREICNNLGISCRRPYRRRAAAVAGNSRPGARADNPNRRDRALMLAGWLRDLYEELGCDVPEGLTALLGHKTKDDENGSDD